MTILDLRKEALARLVTGVLCALCLAVTAVTPALAAGRVRAIHTVQSAKRGRCVERRHGHARHARRCHAKRHRSIVPAPVPVAPTLVQAAPAVLAGELRPQIAVQSPGPSSTTAPVAAATSEVPETTPVLPPSEPPSVPHVQVNAVEYSFSLSRTTVPAGKVDLEFVNNGQDEHNLNLETPEEGAPTEAFGNTPSKGVGDLELELRPGSYTFFCSLPGHEARGMKATLIVE